MESAVLDQVAVDIAGGRTVLRANGSVVVFDGFLTLYQEDQDDPSDDDEQDRRLPNLTEGQSVNRDTVTPEQHFTQPPPRFSEASLVKRLEELGIGRPSTYASIMQVLQDRNYVRIEKRRFIPEDRGRLVTAFLTSFFERYVQYNFTADLEGQLDDISGGRIDWKKVLSDFWSAFSESIGGTKDLSITQVINALDEELGPHFFPETGNGVDPRLCPSCQTGRIGLRLGRFGAFIGCTNYPTCRYTRRLGVENGANGNGESEGPKELGKDPATGLTVSLRRGPYGDYVQLGEAEKVEKADKAAKAKEKGKDKAKSKPKRVSLPRGVAPADVDLTRALGLLSLPREIGAHPETGHMIIAGIGRFGPYLKHDNSFKSIGADDDVLTIGLNRAVTLLAEGPGKRQGPPGKPVGDHPADGKPITLHSGRYGPYIRHGKLLASLPRNSNSDELTLESAVAILAARVEFITNKEGGASGKGATRKKKSKAKAEAAPETTDEDPTKTKPKRAVRKKPATG
jgi:DNA topoisomerase-1